MMRPKPLERLHVLDVLLLQLVHMPRTSNMVILASAAAPSSRVCPVVEAEV